LRHLARSEEIRETPASETTYTTAVTVPEIPTFRRYPEVSCRHPSGKFFQFDRTPRPFRRCSQNPRFLGKNPCSKFAPFGAPSWNGRYLRILAIASRSPKGRNPPEPVKISNRRAEPMKAGLRPLISPAHDHAPARPLRRARCRPSR
jgi:hypothetical protein